MASKRQEPQEVERRQQRRVDVGAAASTSRGGAGGPLDPTEEDPHSPALDPRLETEFYSAEMGLGETPTATPSRSASGGMHVVVALMAKFGGQMGVYGGALGEFGSVLASTALAREGGRGGKVDKNALTPAASFRGPQGRFATVIKSEDGGPRWCRPLFRKDPQKPDALMRYDHITQDAKDHGKVVCRLCGKGVSFAGSSLTTCVKHVASHGVTRTLAQLAEEWCEQAEAKNEHFPLAQWRALVEEKTGDPRISRFMQQEAYPVGHKLWQETKEALARWIATDSIQLSVCESPAFRNFCRALNGRCPGYSRKAITAKVSII